MCGGVSLPSSTAVRIRSMLVGCTSVPLPALSRRRGSRSVRVGGAHDGARLRRGTAQPAARGAGDIVDVNGERRSSPPPRSCRAHCVANALLFCAIGEQAC